MPRHLISDAAWKEQRDSHCPCLLSSEPTVKGTGLTKSAGKEDPVELDSSQTLWNDIGGVVIRGNMFNRQKWNTSTLIVILLKKLKRIMIIKYHNF